MVRNRKGTLDELDLPAQRTIIFRVHLVHRRVIHEQKWNLERVIVLHSKGIETHSFKMNLILAGKKYQKFL